MNSVILKKLLIIGAGGHGRSVAEAAMLSGQFEIVGFLDDAACVGELILGYPVLGRISDFSTIHVSVDCIFIAIGDNAIRERLTIQFKHINCNFATIIHPRACISPSALIDMGSVVLSNAVIGVNAKIGQSVIVNAGSVIEHDSIIEDYAHLGIMSAVAAHSILGYASWMHPGSVLTYRTKTPSHLVIKNKNAYDFS
jgi:sugar O-acyltransferase (sialic acid O-acetyltransferase NeuD family)